MDCNRKNLCTNLTIQRMLSVSMSNDDISTELFFRCEVKAKRYRYRYCRGSNRVVKNPDMKSAISLDNKKYRRRRRFLLYST